MLRFGIQARGASLVERHASDVTKAKKATGGKDGGKKNFSWSREEDFEQRRKFTPQVRDLPPQRYFLRCANAWYIRFRARGGKLSLVDNFFSNILRTYSGNGSFTHTPRTEQTAPPSRFFNNSPRRHYV